MADLFGEETVALVKAKKRPVGESAVPKVIERYHERFLSRFGFKPKISGGRDGKHVKELVAAWGATAVLGLVDEFFSTTDPKVTRSDYSLQAFYTLAQGLMIASAVGKPDQRSAEIMDAVSRARGSQRTVRRG